MHASTPARRPLAEATFRPPRALGVIAGGGLVVWAAVLAGFTAQVAAGAEPGFKTFLAWLVTAMLGALALVFLNWTYAVARLKYVIDATALTIVWGFRRVVIPIETIQRMLPGRTLDEARVDGLNWWGCHVGGADVKRLGFTLFYSTHNSPDELLYVVTTEESYALTVVDHAAFAEAVRGRAGLGPVAHHIQRSTATGLAAFPFWRDRVAITAAAFVVIGAIGLAGYIYARYPGLPDVVQLDFPALGGVVRVGAKRELLRIAYLGVGVGAVNVVLGVLLHARERAAGLWLFASAAMLQVVLFGAALLAFSRA